MSHVIIAIDAMGGDSGPNVTVPACLQALAKHPELKLILVGNQSVLEQQLASVQFDAQRLLIQHASQQIAMDESPAQALRAKKDSSLRVAINLVKQGIAQACVSAGNTGALMATASFVLKTLPGVDRPAFIATLPTSKLDMCVRILDLGANVDASAEQLLEFAVMGSVAAQALGVVQPKVALLNIGVEEIKGNQLVKQASQLLGNQPGINYMGYIEADDIFKGAADIVVCDGFVGNVLLKTTEGLAKMIGSYANSAFKQNIFSMLAGLFALPVLSKLRRRLNPASYNGASLLGLQGIVIKSHGSANSYAFAQAITQAVLEVNNEIPKRIYSEVAHLLQRPSA